MGGGQECTTGYPHCVCSEKYACGPFTASVNGYAPMVAAILATDVVSVLYELLIESNFVAWLLLSMLILLLFFLRNSLKVYIVRDLAVCAYSVKTVCFTLRLLVCSLTLLRCFFVR